MCKGKQSSVPTSEKQNSHCTEPQWHKCIIKQNTAEFSSASITIPEKKTKLLRNAFLFAGHTAERE